MWKQRLSSKMYISPSVKGKYIIFLHTVCVFLVVMNLVWICYNMSQTTFALENLEETYRLLQPREWDVVLDDV